MVTRSKGGVLVNTRRALVEAVLNVIRSYSELSFSISLFIGLPLDLSTESRHPILLRSDMDILFSLKVVLLVSRTTSVVLRC